MDSANSDPGSGDTPRRRGRPRKDQKKLRDTRTVRLALDLLERVKEHQEKQRAQIGYVRGISEILMTAMEVYERRHTTALDIGMLPTKEQRIVRRIVSFLAGRPKPGKKDVMAFLDAIVARIDLGRQRGKKNAAR